MSNGSVLKYDGYVRVSRVGGRAGESYRSPGDQLAIIERLAAAHGLVLDEVVTEEDVSGAKKAAQRELGRLVQKVLDGESGGLVVWKVSRFSRDQVDGILTAAAIREAGGRIIGEDLDTAAPMGKALLGFLLGWAEEERDARRAGWKRAVDGATARGVLVGITPVGFDRNEDGTLRQNADADAVRRVFLDRAAGCLWHRLADDLEADGVEPAAYRYAREHGEEVGEISWHVNSVRSIVSNKIYKGILKNGIEHYVPAYAIVTGDEWAAAQPVTKGSRRDGGAWALLSGLVHCHGCGGGLTPTSSTRGGVRHAYYVCRNRACVKAGRNARVEAEALEAYIVPAALQAFAAGVAERGIGSDADVEKIVALEQEVTKAESRRRIAGLNLDPENAEDVEALETLSAEVSAGKVALDNERGKSRKFLTEEEARALIDTGTLTQRREAIRRVIDGVNVARKGDPDPSLSDVEHEWLDANPEEVAEHDAWYREAFGEVKKQHPIARRVRIDWARYLTSAT